MNMKEKIIAKWGAIAKASKKFGKIAMCGVTLLGATGGIMAVNNVAGNVMNVQAASITTYSLVNSSGTVLGDKSLTTEGNLYYAKFTVSEYDDNGYVNYQVSEKTTVTQGQNITKTFTERFQGDTPDDCTYIFSTNSNFFEFADYFASQKIDPGSTTMYGASDLYNYIKTTPYSYMISEMMTAARSSSISYTLSSAVVNTDETAPALETQVFLTDVDNPIALEDILKEVHFVDGVDGVIEETVVSDNYTPNKNRVGEWAVQVKATDAAGNTGTGTIIVRVLDKTGPIITGQTTFTSNMSSPLTIENILSKLTATDNVDGNISDNIEIVSNGFTGNENIVGNKSIVVRVRDSAGNVSVDTTLKVNCVDDVKPVISIKDGYSDSYTTSYENKMDINTILESIVVTDNIDSNLSYEIIENKYEGNDTIPNTYTIKLRATDTAGNISEIKTITITVTDEIPPVFFVSGKFIGISQANTLTHQELVNLLIYMEGLIAEEGAAVNLLSFGGYETDAVNTPGVYTLSYKTRTADGVESEVKTATIKVLGETENSSSAGEREEKGFFEKLWDGIKNIFSKIKNWFKGLFD